VARVCAWVRAPMSRRLGIHEAAEAESLTRYLAVVLVARSRDARVRDRIDDSSRYRDWKDQARHDAAASRARARQALHRQRGGARRQLRATANSHRT
jgi:hypothetical protein